MNDIKIKAVMSKDRRRLYVQDGSGVRPVVLLQKFTGHIEPAPNGEGLLASRELVTYITDTLGVDPSVKPGETLPHKGSPLDWKAAPAPEPVEPPTFKGVAFEWDPVPDPHPVETPPLADPEE